MESLYLFVTTGCAECFFHMLYFLFTWAMLTANKFNDDDDDDEYEKALPQAESCWLWASTAQNYEW